MSAVSSKVNGSAAVQGDLWGARARDWADTQEGFSRQLFEAGLQKLAIGAGSLLLDVGCGTGLACAIAAERGAKVNGIDASAPSIEIARQRTPHGDFRVGEMEDLPYADHTFDAVTGFNSFQYATSPVNALREARRVVKPGGKVLIAVWGKAEHCEGAAVLKALGSLLPPPPPGAPGPFALSEDGALEALVSEAGLTPLESDEAPSIWTFANLDEALRASLSAGPATRAIRHSGEERVKEAVMQALAPFKTASGGYRLENEFRYLVAKA
jgi:SAM-dependent methyltransferase